jgi:DNA repair photolyase
MFTSPNPPNRYHTSHVEWDEPPLPPRLQLRDDHPRTALSENDSADVGFRWSINPYRGCTHACAYCYARRTHEHLDLGAGSDFERVIVVKRGLAELLRAELQRRSWRGEPVHFSGVTDAWQPIERKLGVTRSCLEVLVAHRNPVSLITRSPLVLRDLDLLCQLLPHHAVRAAVSIPIGEAALARALEPGAAPPGARFATVRALAEAGIPVGVSLAPILPGLTDHLIASTLERAAEAGACWAFAGLVRLPGSVEQVFTERLTAAVPGRAAGTLARLAAMKPPPGQRMGGDGPAWEVLRRQVEVHRARHGLADRAPAFPTQSPFRRPGHAVQTSLFG